MKTIAQQLNIKEFPFDIKDSNGNIIYVENSDGWWSKRECDSKGKEIYFEDSNGYWYKREYDSNGNTIYKETSNGYWYKQKWNSNGNTIYYENSDGIIRDNQPEPIPEYTMEELQSILGKEFKIKK